MKRRLAVIVPVLALAGGCLAPTLKHSGEELAKPILLYANATWEEGTTEVRLRGVTAQILNVCRFSSEIILCPRW